MIFRTAGPAFHGPASAGSRCSAPPDSCGPWAPCKCPRRAGSVHGAGRDDAPVCAPCLGDAAPAHELGRVPVRVAVEGERLAWPVRDVRGAVCVLSPRRAVRREDSILDSCFSRNSMPAGCGCHILNRIFADLFLRLICGGRQLCGWSRSRKLGSLRPSGARKCRREERLRGSAAIGGPYYGTHVS
jgi:hypothetical protein